MTQFLPAQWQPAPSHCHQRKLRHDRPVATTGASQMSFYLTGTSNLLNSHTGCTGALLALLHWHWIGLGSQTLWAHGIWVFFKKKLGQFLLGQTNIPSTEPPSVGTDQFEPERSELCYCSTCTGGWGMCARACKHSSSIFINAFDLCITSCIHMHCFKIQKSDLLIVALCAETLHSKTAHFKKSPTM